MRRFAALAVAAVVTLSVTADAGASTTGWRIDTAAPLPANSAGLLGARVTAVDCSSARSCALVGEYQPTGADLSPYVRVMIGPNGWRTPVAAPLPADAGRHPAAHLSDVACATTRCVAVGGYGAGAGHPLLVTFQDGQWTAVPLSTVTGALSRVACNDVECLAIGVTDPTSPSGPLFVDDADGTWQARAVSTPSTTPNTPPNATAVDCPATGACRAVGGNDTGALEYVRDGAQWVGGYLPTPVGAGSPGLHGALSCVAEAACVALVERVTATGRAVLGETLTGGSWQASLVRSVQSLSDVDVDCPSDLWCAGVYTERPSARAFQAQLLTLDHGAWDVRPAFAPSDARDHANVSLEAVSCYAVRACAAVGGYAAEDTLRRPVVESMDQRWTPIGLSLPQFTFGPYDSAELHDVTCTRVQCYAVGDFPGRRALHHAGPVLATSARST